MRLSERVDASIPQKGKMGSRSSWGEIRPSTSSPSEDRRSEGGSQKKKKGRTSGWSPALLTHGQKAKGDRHEKQESQGTRALPLEKEPSA